MNSAHNSPAPEEEVPGTDMQPDDAGTAASGNANRGTAAEPAMKQTSKTDAERDAPRGGDKPAEGR
jgi:hypothetical protein